MLHDWWMAHRLEIYLDLGFAALLLFGVLVIAVVLWFKNRRRRS